MTEAEEIERAILQTRIKALEMCIEASIDVFAKISHYNQTEADLIDHHVAIIQDCLNAKKEYEPPALVEELKAVRDKLKDENTKYALDLFRANAALEFAKKALKEMTYLHYGSIGVMETAAQLALQSVITIEKGE